ncbi:hypothetical protein B0H14DRAFT_3508671 [Mycena olivaceomarginata]|nr:hypothetical protein B0H14DRAFT_3508671 [Mycena olivaceomarginata]
MALNGTRPIRKVDNATDYRGHLILCLAAIEDGHGLGVGRGARCLRGRDALSRFFGEAFIAPPAIGLKSPLMHARIHMRVGGRRLGCAVWKIDETGSEYGERLSASRIWSPLCLLCFPSTAARQTEDPTVSRTSFCLTCAVVRCGRFFAVIMIRRPCGLCLGACARDSTTPPAGVGGCWLSSQPAIFEISFALVPAPLSLDRAFPGPGDRIYPCFLVLDKYRRAPSAAPPAPSAAPPAPSAHPPPHSPSRARITTKKKTLDGSPHEDVAGGGYADGPFDARGDYPRTMAGRGGPGPTLMTATMGCQREREARTGGGGGRGATLPFVAPPGPPLPFRREAHDSGDLPPASDYATQRIDAQMLILRDFIASLHPHPPPGSSLAISTDAPEPELTPPDHLRTLAHLRSDIVHTIRQVVGVVSKYAGGALPEPARGRRGEQRQRRDESGHSGSGERDGVAAAAGSGGASRRGAGVAGSTRSQRGTSVSVGDAGGVGSPTPSAPGSPHAHLRPLHPHAHSRRGSVQGGVEPGKALAAAQKVLVLATESLDMMRGVTAVMVDRLRTVGIQRGMDGLALPDGSGEHGHWAGATPAWTAGAPRSPGGYTSTSGTRSPAYGSDTRYASGARSPTTYAPSDGRSSTYVSSAPSPAAYASGSGAPSPAFGIGGMNLGSGSSRYPTPAPGGEEERERERDEGGMEVDR